MRNYELTVLLDGKVTSAKKKKIQETIEKTATTLKGKVKEVKDLGKKSDTGVYLHFILELEGSAAKEILGKLSAEEEILRYLLVRKN